MEYSKAEKAVLDMVHCEDFRQVGKKEIMQIMSALPSMDKEVALKVIGNVPDFLNLATEGFKEMFKITDKMLEDSANENTIIFNSYASTIAVLQEKAKDPNITHEEFLVYMDEIRRFTDDFMEVKKHSDQQKLKMLGIVGGTLTAVIGIVAAAAFGVNINADDIDPNDFV